MNPDIRQRLAVASKQLSSTQEKRPSDHKRRPKRERRSFIAIVIVASTVAIAILAVLVIARKNHTPAPPAVVPQHIAQSVSFPVYYPDPQELPSEFMLDRGSFSAANQAVVYSVVYDTNKTIAFTVQEKPSENDLKTFYVNQLPLRNEIKVPAGTAAVGVLNNQTLVSLPTNENAWLLITAPLDVNQDHLQELLGAIKP